MSNMKDLIKNKMRTSKESAHAQLIDVTTENNIDVNVDVNTNVNIFKPASKKKKFEDTHTRQTFYIENELLKKLSKFAGREKGEKTRIINEALRSYMDLSTK